jgi:hypothetical protein
MLAANIVGALNLDAPLKLTGTVKVESTPVLAT